MRDVINVLEKNIKEVVSRLDSSKFFGLNNSATKRPDLFNFLVSLGVERGYPKELTSKKTSFVRTEYIENNNCRFLYSSLYFHEMISDNPTEKIDMITNDNEILDLVEKYANTGFDVIAEYMDQYSDEEMMLDLISQMDDWYKEYFGEDAF